MSVILSIAAVVLSASTVTLETIDGQKHTGDLTQLDQQQAVITNATDSATVDVDQILRVVNDDRLDRLVEPRLTIWLTDGSVFAATRFELQNDLARIGFASYPRHHWSASFQCHGRCQQEFDQMPYSVSPYFFMPHFYMT